MDKLDKLNELDKHVQTIKFFRERIPAFACVPGCHDCCGPVLASTVEMARLPRKNQQEQEAALAVLGCPHLGPDGCQVYEERPLICRLFGTTPRLACPNGKRPEVMIAPVIEERVYRYFEQVRHVLV